MQSKLDLPSVQPRHTWWVSIVFNTTPTTPVTLNGEARELVEDFTYLGSLISKDKQPKKTSKQDREKPAVLLPNFRPFGVQPEYHEHKVKTLQQ